MLISLSISSSTLCFGGSVFTVEIISISSIDVEDDGGGEDGAESGCVGVGTCAGTGTCTVCVGTCAGTCAGTENDGAISSFNLRSHTNASLPSYFYRRPLE